MIRRHISVPALAVLVALTLGAGCSSSDSSDAKDASAKTTTTAKAGSGETTDTSDTSEADGDTSTTVAGGTGGGDDIELTGDFCEKARQLEGASDEIFGEDTTDTSPEGLLAGVQQMFRALDNVYGQLNEDPPAAIADEIGVLAEFASSNYEKVKDMTSYEEAAKIAQTAFGEDSVSDEFQAASDKIGAYVEEECGISQE